jgi:hypothetical protein
MMAGTAMLTPVAASSPFAAAAGWLVVVGGAGCVVVVDDVTVVVVVGVVGTVVLVVVVGVVVVVVVGQLDGQIVGIVGGDVQHGVAAVAGAANVISAPAATVTTLSATCDRVFMRVNLPLPDLGGPGTVSTTDVEDSVHRVLLGPAGPASATVHPAGICWYSASVAATNRRTGMPACSASAAQ